MIPEEIRLHGKRRLCSLQIRDIGAVSVSIDGTYSSDIGVKLSCVVCFIRIAGRKLHGMVKSGFDACTGRRGSIPDSGARVGVFLNAGVRLNHNN